jgi:hypothetical protein
MGYNHSKLKQTTAEKHQSDETGDMKELLSDAETDCTECSRTPAHTKYVLRRWKFHVSRLLGDTVDDEGSGRGGGRGRRRS